MPTARCVGFGVPAAAMPGGRCRAGGSGRIVARKDDTEIGGQNEAFGPTQWTVLDGARTTDPERRRKAVAAVAARYWRPVYAYLRQKGMGNEDAKDLTQGFFVEVVMKRKLIQRAAREKGRFRTFLLTALDRFAASDHRKKTAGIRRPAGGVLPLDAMAAGAPAIPEKAASPAEAFSRTWASSLISEVLDEVEAACRQAGQATHWEVFRSTVVAPALLGAKAPALSDLCEELKIATKSKASNMNVTVKRRFRSILRTKVRALVGSDEELEAEIRELMEILSHPGAVGRSDVRIE